MNDADQLERLMQSCPARCIMSGIGGFGIGGMFSMFMFSTTFVEPIETKRSLLQNVKFAYKGMGSAMWNGAKSFGKLGAIYSATECVIEKYRAKHDLINPLLAGLVTGAVIAKSSGLKSMALSAVGFSLFGTAIEYYTMHW